MQQGLRALAGIGHAGLCRHRTVEQAHRLQQVDAGLLVHAAQHSGARGLGLAAWMAAVA